MSALKTPVLFILFNRPDTTEVVFREIAKAKPTRLLVVADGPRPGRPDEALRCREARAIISRVDWDCEVSTNFSEVNLGCKERVSSGITWALSQVPEAIILEDDCVPDPSFFTFCAEMLERYREDTEVMMVAGTSFLGSRAPTEESYYFSKVPLIWGWATWARAWNHYDLEMRGWESYRGSEEFRGIFPSFTARRHYRRQLDRTHAGGLNTWDLQWSYTVWKNHGLCVNPTRNLIRNIGFGPGATHTHFYDPAFDPPVFEMPFPLSPPATRKPNPRLDRVWLDRHYSLRAKVWRRLRPYYLKFFGDLK